MSNKVSRTGNLHLNKPKKKPNHNAQLKQAQLLWPMTRTFPSPLTSPHLLCSPPHLRPTTPRQHQPLLAHTETQKNTIISTNLQNPSANNEHERNNECRCRCMCVCGPRSQIYERVKNRCAGVCMKASMAERCSRW